MRDGQVVDGSGRRLFSVAEAGEGRFFQATERWVNRPTRDLDGGPIPICQSPVFGYSAQRAVVDVDLELGLVRVVQIDACQDTGTVVNPIALEAQVEGGAVQGMGLALMEDFKVGEGQPQNPDFEFYLVPTLVDAPAIAVELVSDPEPGIELGMKGRRGDPDRQRLAGGRLGDARRHRAGPPGGADRARAHRPRAPGRHPPGGPPRDRRPARGPAAGDPAGRARRTPPASGHGARLTRSRPAACVPIAKADGKATRGRLMNDARDSAQLDPIGFVGLGHMGGNMAARFLDAGYPVRGTARSRERAGWLVDRGLDWLDTPREVAEAASFVLTSLPDDDAVNAVAAGADGLLAGLGAGKVWADLSTVSPGVSRDLSARVAERGAEMLDAPVSGSVPQIESGTLTIMVGGGEEAYASVEPILRLLGTPSRIGDNGQGLVLKLAINISLAVQMVAFSEGLLLAERDGIDPALAGEVMAAKLDRLADAQSAPAAGARAARGGLVRRRPAAQGHRPRAGYGQGARRRLPHGARGRQGAREGGRRGVRAPRHRHPLRRAGADEAGGLRGGSASALSRRPDAPLKPRSGIPDWTAKYARSNLVIEGEQP